MRETLGPRARSAAGPDGRDRVRLHGHEPRFRKYTRLRVLVAGRGEDGQKGGQADPGPVRGLRRRRASGVRRRGGAGGVGGEPHAAARHARAVSKYGV